MKTTAICFLVVAAYSIATGADSVPTDNDWLWLERNSWNALSTLMPLEDASRSVVTFRTSRLVQLDFPECYFRIDQDFRSQRLSAKVVAPTGQSIQPQLLDLHRHNPDAALDQLLPQVKLTTAELSEDTCPVIRDRMVKLAKVRISIPALNGLVLDSPEYRIVIKTGDGNIDATLCQEQLPIVHWAVQSCAALRRCAEAEHETAKR